MELNREQVKSAIRWFISTFSGIFIGWATAKGWDVSGITSIFSNESIIGLVASAVVLIWGWFSKTKPGLINAAVGAVPEIKKVEIQATSLAPAAVQSASDIVQKTGPTVVASGKL